ncbi:hypothetical protein [Aliiglaciecola lipolytica]|uniref:hypothetical protein n=1 Tax=Aliiglaciecola lipolytica TaxID=477689 RepID=UPI0002F50950|nr:hypothetical protein [Aliiglaciecola lipolytica]
MKKQYQELLFSPSDFVWNVQSPFAPWMQRLCVEVPETKKHQDSLDPLLAYSVISMSIKRINGK